MMLCSSLAIDGHLAIHSHLRAIQFYASLAGNEVCHIFLPVIQPAVNDSFPQNGVAPFSLMLRIRHC